MKSTWTWTWTWTWTRSLRSLMKYYSTLEQKFRISARPCNILYVFNSIECSFTINLIKSQFLGSEWDYVIISLVRSMKEHDIEREPSLSWLREHLGFLTDDHQMNVGITRARRGLCIIGKSRFRLRTFHEPNLMHWIKYMRSLASESIRSTCIRLSFLI